jgi:hypothetical protein
MRTRRDFLTPAIVIGGIIIVIFALWVVICDAQTHTMPGSNVVPSGATLTISSGGTINAAAGSTVTGFGSPLQWDGGATNLVAATGRTSLALVPGTNVEVPLTFSTGLTRTTNTVTVNTSQNIATLSNLTTNGFVKTGGAVGTLSVDTATYQASNANLTSWAAITRASGVDTFIATPSSANLRGALTDENGTGAALFSGATTPDFTTGFTIGAAAASGKILIGNGTNYVPSTPTYPNSASVAGTIMQAGGTNWAASTPTWPTAAGTAGYTIRSDGTNFASYPQDMFNSSVTSQATFSTSDLYVTNSNVVVAAGDFKAKGQYRCLFDMTKSAGTGAIVISLRVGTLGTTGDPAILTFTFGAGTAIADTGTFEIIATWRTVGSGTSAVMQGVCRAQKNAATTTGLWNNAGTDLVIVAATSSGFASNTATNVGISFNGSTAFAGTSTLCQATLIQ